MEWDVFLLPKAALCLGKGHQPLTAPTMMPLMKYFWIQG